LSFFDGTYYQLSIDVDGELGFEKDESYFHKVRMVVVL
jgi:hypothetical protein